MQFPVVCNDPATDLHYLNLQRELHRTFQTLALAA